MGAGMDHNVVRGEKAAGEYYVYILKCADGSLYTGWTTQLERRIHAHNSGKASKYTRSRLPVELVYYEAVESKSEALKREYAIKRLSRDGKLGMIRTWSDTEKIIKNEKS
jgi:putative endonuclease